LHQRVQDLTEQLEAANAKIASLEKVRHKLLGDIDDAQVDVERVYSNLKHQKQWTRFIFTKQANSFAQSLEKKQKGFDKVLDEWKKKCQDVASELDAAQRDTRLLSTENFKLKTSLDESAEQVESVRRENKSLAQEIKDLADQLGEGGRSVHEMQKMVRRLEVEKEELQVTI